MFNKKIFISIVVAAAFIAGNVSALASSNDLLRMDVKRSSMNDAVDVTFYTTGPSTNSVVTRKDDNKYIVLLPNVAGSASVIPNIAGVKDLVSEVDVKNIDDGIGGYTKVTFITTKPLKIQTSTQKTSPLTQAQQDYKNLIAANNTKPANTNSQKSVSNTVNAKVSTPKTSATAKSQNSNNKTSSNVVNSPNVKLTVAQIIQNAKSQPVGSDFKKENNQNLKKESLPANQNIAASQNQTKQVNETAKSLMNSANSKTTISEKVSTVSPQPVADKELTPQLNTPEKTVTQKTAASEEVSQNTASEQNLTQEPQQQEQTTKKSKTSMTGFSIFGGLLLLGIIMNMLSRSLVKRARKFNLKTTGYEGGTGEKVDYQDIIDNKSLNWQEKFKLFTQKDNKQNSDASTEDYSYVTNMNTENKPMTKEQVLDTVRSQLEHSYNGVSDEPVIENPSEIISEEDVITENISKAKLKSFAKNRKLNETNRNILANDKKPVTDPLKESRFVKLRNSALSISRRNSANSDLNISDLLRTGNKYLDNNKNEVMKMDEKKENYVLSSLDEYLSILDSEDQMKADTSADVAKTLSQIKSRDVMNRSGITNPMERINPMNRGQKTPALNGLVVKSGYNIDADRGFYLVNLDGISALVGRVKDEVFVLNKFDKLIDSQLQVRLDYGTVYIVKAGGYKCLVDVAQGKMGKLLEI